ncbi:MAG TPA: multicopper oxidase family protein [Ramlibacter sp.]|nr:multicopper oxidase family protein [Ramlibacter sp.]
MHATAFLMPLRRRQLLAGGASSLLLGACAVAGRRTRPVELVAAPTEAALRGAGHPATAVWSYGGGVPGPEIRVPQGSRLRVDFRNRLPVETTVHWHGLRVPHAMDGVPHLTQLPVAPGERFTYEFTLPDAGTFWYHSHLRSSEQVERGLYGLVVVEEPAPLPVDREWTWVLDDWRLTRDGQLARDFGQLHDVSHAGRIGNVVTLNGRVPRPLAVRRGERIRIRIVNAANARIFGLQFDGHRPQVVALDGHPVTPHLPQGGTLVLGPGMRADVVLDAVGEPGSRHAVGDVFYPRAAYDLLELAYEAQPLRDAAPAALPALAPNPLSEPDLQAAVRHEIRFEGGMMGRLHTALLDGRPMDLRALLGAGKAWAVNGVAAGHGHGRSHGHGEHPALTLQLGKSYRVLLRNDTRWHHPIHLHGHAFRLLERSGLPVPHRPWLDTVLLAPDESAEIAFVADNPGDWMLHCHVLEHQDGGMMAVVRVA